MCKERRERERRGERKWKSGEMEKERRVGRVKGERESKFPSIPLE